MTPRTKVELCRKANTLQAKYAEKINVINPRQVRILIVDDETTLRELLATRFSIFGFQVETANDGLEAWGKISTDPQIKIVVTDLSMPGLTGQELLKKCKSANTESPKIFTITGRADWSEELLLALGAEGVLQKPFDARTLLNITRNSLLSVTERLKIAPSTKPSITLRREFSSVLEAGADLAIGRGGVFLRTRQEQIPEIGLNLGLDLRLGELILEGCGVVRWRRQEFTPHCSQVGVELLHLTPESLKTFENWIQKNPQTSFVPSPQIPNSMPSTAKLQSTG
jgi:CheY-like chemotaxis protein